MNEEHRTKRQWRDYRTSAGGRPVKDFIDQLEDEEAAELVAAMKEVTTHGLRAAKHLRASIYEVIANCGTRDFRLLFSVEGRFSQVLLSLSAFEKRTQKTPGREIELAEGRLRAWRARGAALRKRRLNG